VNETFSQTVLSENIFESSENNIRLFPVEGS